MAFAVPIFNEGFAVPIFSEGIDGDLGIVWCIKVTAAINKLLCMKNAGFEKYLLTSNVLNHLFICLNILIKIISNWIKN